MYTIKVDKRINQILNVYYRFGIWRNEDESAYFRKTTWKMFYFIFFLGYPLCLISCGLLANDKNESIFPITAGIVVFVLVVKLGYMLWKKEMLRALILEIGTHSIADAEEFMRVNVKVNKLIKFSLSFLLMTTVGCSGEIIFYLPIFSGEKRLPLNLWFQFNWENNVVTYWIVYFYSAAAITIILVAISFDVILWYLMMNCAIKYEILGNQFRNMAAKEPTMKRGKNSETKNQNSQELVALIKILLIVKATINRFKSCFEIIFLLQITTSGICICGLVYALAFLDQYDDLVQTTLNCMILVHNVFDILMLMYLGNEIKLSSERLSYSAFESNWLGQAKSFKVCLIILIEVLKNPQELMIGKLYPLNLNTFTSILNFAYSMLNILKTSIK